MSRWAVEAIATGPDGAVKLSVIKDEPPNATERQDYKAQASGFYRRQYGSWCKGLDCHVWPLGGSGQLALNDDG